MDNFSNYSIAFFAFLCFKKQEMNQPQTLTLLKLTEELNHVCICSSFLSYSFPEFTFPLTLNECQLLFKDYPQRPLF